MDHQEYHKFMEENIRERAEIAAKSAILQQNMEALRQIYKILEGRQLSADASCVDATDKVVHMSCQNECALKRHIRGCIIYVEAIKIWDEMTLKEC